MIVNKIGLNREELVKKEMYKTIFLGPLYAIFMLTVLYLSASKNLILYYILAAFFLFLFFVFIIYAPFRMLKRHSHTIYSITIENNYIYFSTFPALWGKRRRYEAYISELQLKKSTFRWYGRNMEKGGVVLSIKGKEFYLVEDFFDQYNMIIVELNL